MSATAGAKAAPAVRGSRVTLAQIYSVTLFARFALDSLTGGAILDRSTINSSLRDFVKLLDLGVAERLNLPEPVASDITKVRDSIHALTKRCEPEIPVDKLHLVVLVLETLVLEVMKETLRHLREVRGQLRASRGD